MYVLILILAFAGFASAQGMSMAGTENTVGALSSGTSIEPGATAESSAMVHKALGQWSLMLHANAFFVSTQQTGPRGQDKVFSSNWIMPMLQRQSGRHTVMFRTMMSLEPVTVTKRRYPLLFQTGETAFGLPIVDGQHPHDLLMEVAGRYDFHLSDRAQLFVYGGPIAEPALGPPAFPHRASASENPAAVLGHHMQDSTHISNEVATLGFVSGPVQLEASTFHGQEPNENRWNIDTGKPDSFSSRLTFAIRNNIAGQFSIGRLNDREALEPGLDTVRMTASLHHARSFSRGQISSSLIWGRNKDIHGGDKRVFNAYTAESTAKIDRNWLWARIENVDRDRTILAGETPAALAVEEEPAGRVQAYTFGYERELPAQKSVSVGIGGQVTVYGLTSEMKTVYGNRPAGFTLFLRLRPAGNMSAHMRMMHRH